MIFFVVEINYITLSGGATGTFYLSDTGYVSSTVGVRAYLPVVDQPLSMTRQLPVAPESGTKVGASWGEIVILNQRDNNGVGAWDALIDAKAIAGQAVAVYQCEKTFDAARGIWLDPAQPYTGKQIFTGIATAWVSDGETVRVAIRDVLAATEIPVQTNFYGGAGGADGTATNLGKPIPKTRGKVLNITPVLIDPTNLIYQWTDLSGTVIAVYERGYAGFTFAGDFANYAGLVAATVPAGNYATCIAHGYLRMGTQPTGPLTIDATGEFSPLAGTLKPGTLAHDTIIKEAGVSSSLVDAASFTDLDSDCPYDTGFYTADQPFTTVQLLDLLLRGLGAAIGCDRAGLASVFRIEPPSGSPTVTFTTAQILRNRTVAMPSSVTQPNWRRSVGYMRNYTVEVDNLSPLITAAQIQFLAREYDFAVWADASIKTNWPTAMDPGNLATQILNQADAQAMANFFGSLWGVQRYLYDHDIPIEADLAELGDVVKVTYPSGPLTAGRLGVMSGESIDVKNRLVTMRVLY